IVGQVIATREGINVIGPWVVGADINEASGIIFIRGLIVQIARFDMTRCVFGCCHPRVVILVSTLPAEAERQEHSVALMRNVSLPYKRDVTDIFMLDCCIDCSAWADELVQAKSKCRHTGARVWCTLITCEQPALDDGRTICFIDPSQ